MAEIAPNFPVEDFLRYYGNTHIRYRGVPVWVHPNVDREGRVTLQALEGRVPPVSVPVNELLDWQNLRWPELGWVDFSGAPWYVVRVPRRDVSKGISSANCTATVPAYMQRVLSATGTQIVRRPMDNRPFWGSLFGNQSRPLGEAVQEVLEGRRLYSVVNRRVAVMVNGDKDTATQFPVVVFVKNLLAARVDGEGKLHQLGEIDVSEAIE